MSGQAIRRSQFLTTYGPGAILEGPDGPRVIPSLDQSEVFDDDHPVTDFEITDQRLSTALLGGARILRLPSNAELGQPDTHWIYKTVRFPMWSLCTKHNVLYYKRSGSGTQACPRCRPLGSEDEAIARAKLQAIRFVFACERGHLDDVYWPTLMQHLRHPCNPTYLLWKGGGSLRQVQIVCPDCKGEINLGFAYSQDHHCSGRYPEHGFTRGTCDAPARMIQRGAANLRLPELVSALTIPPADTRLHRLLEMKSLQIILKLLIKNNPSPSKGDLLDMLDTLGSTVGPTVRAQINHYPDTEVQAAIAQLNSGTQPQDNIMLRQQEFEALIRAAENGAPAQKSSTPGAPPQFEVIRQDVREITTSAGLHLRVTPISRLRVVMVQTGYRRLDPLKSAMVPITYEDSEGTIWYPGTELFGEGLFIDLAPKSLVANWHPTLHGSATTNWLNAWFDPVKYRQKPRDDGERDYLHPLFIWWHCLSHRIINALSIDSGYSSAAVRERVYIKTDSDGNARGGILLFTAQPGGDGTLGGLIALVSSFERVIRNALLTIDSCSNDPLCGDERFRPGRYNGAACYACQLVSETSCEHRNTHLDRATLLENPL